MPAMKSSADPMRNIRLDLCYDGTRYKGWQRLSGVENTIQGKLEQTLSRILGESIEISGSGRTDAGAHARNQVVSFHTESNMPCAEILSQLQRYLPEDIGIYSCKEAAPRFHARLNAVAKTYQYRIWNSKLPCVFDRRFVYAFELIYKYFLTYPGFHKRITACIKSFLKSFQYLTKLIYIVTMKPCCRLV